MRHEPLVPFARERHGANGFEAPRRSEPRAEDRHEQTEDGDRDRDGAEERQQHRYTSSRVTRQDSQMPANSRHTAAGSSTNRPNPVSNTGATRSWLASEQIEEERRDDEGEEGRLHPQAAALRGGASGDTLVGAGGFAEGAEHLGGRLHRLVRTGQRR